MILAHFGTFDVLNFGDSLFPLIAEHNLKEMFSGFVHVSPVGGRAYSDVPAPVTLQQVNNYDQRIAAVVVGGGNVVHARPSGLGVYGPVKRTAYPNLWAGAAQLAARRNIPLAFNSPGLAQRFGWPTSVVLSGVIDQAVYVSVRDQRSADSIGSSRNVRVVPDTALAISDVFGPLSRSAVDLPKDVAALRDREYIAVHLNERYATGPASEMALILDQLSAQVGIPICLVAIGPCHGDDIYAQKVAAYMRSSPVLFDAPKEVRAIASVIANSRFYVGSSLHGFITATSYGVPAVMVAAASAQHKFTGLLDHLEARERLLNGWDTALAAVRKGASSFSSPANATNARLRIAEHWDLMRAALSGKPNRPAALTRVAPSLPIVAAGLGSFDRHITSRLIRRR